MNTAADEASGETGLGEWQVPPARLRPWDSPEGPRKPMKGFLQKNAMIRFFKK